jgi:hypothetical protein
MTMETQAAAAIEPELLQAAKESVRKVRFTPWPKVSTACGAQMGRASANLGINYERDTKAGLAVAGPAGEYDAGGAYWGCGGSEGPVWAVWRRGRGREGVHYIRAHSADHARSLALCAPA